MFNWKSGAPPAKAKKPEGHELQPTAGSMELEFSNGPTQVPIWMIHLMGGVEAFTEEKRAQLKHFTFQQFAASLTEQSEKQVLNKFQAQFMGHSEEDIRKRSLERHLPSKG
jgi:hypothetical protein